MFDSSPLAITFASLSAKAPFETDCDAGSFFAISTGSHNDASSLLPVASVLVMELVDSSTLLDALSF